MTSATREALDAATTRRGQAAIGALATGVAVAGGTAVLTRLRRGEDRAYRLRREEAVAEGIRRMAAGRADDALDQLRGAGAAEPAAAVHEARKDLKKLRAVIRMARDALGEEPYRRENDRYRDAGRLLSGIRDAHVRVQTFEALRERFPGELDDPELGAVVRQGDAGASTSREGNGLGPFDRAAREIEAGREAIPGWELEGEDWDLLEAGVRRSYRRGRNRFGDVSADATDENVHEWRKRVKDLWYHLRILAPAHPKRIGGMADGVHELSDLLGDHHDLAVLRDHVSDNGAMAHASSLFMLRRAINRRQDELLAKALRSGGKLYAPKPKAFTKKLRSRWRDWR
jgi:CHAD domain-containing protein